MPVRVRVHLFHRRGVPHHRSRQHRLRNLYDHQQDGARAEDVIPRRRLVLADLPLEFLQQLVRDVEVGLDP